MYIFKKCMYVYIVDHFRHEKCSSGHWNKNLNMKYVQSNYISELGVCRIIWKISIWHIILKIIAKKNCSTFFCRRLSWWWTWMKSVLFEVKNNEVIIFTYWISKTFSKYNSYVRAYYYSILFHLAHIYLPIFSQILTKWYGVRNAPGTQDMTPEQEWIMFANLLYSLIGYDLEKLGIVKKNEDQGETSEVVSKKQRTSSDGSTDDWGYLLNSKLHKTVGSTLANLLNLNEISSPTKSTGRSSCSTRRNLMETGDPKNQFNSQSLLFPYMLPVLYSLHLVYEETKLNTLLWDELRSLSAFLYQLSKDLRLDSYVNHYWLDFPTNLTLECEKYESQVSEANLKRLNQPSYFSCEPPNVFKYLNCLLKDLDVGSYPYLPDVNNMSKDLIEVRL